MSLLWNLGAAFKGQQDYSDWQQQKNLRQEQIDFAKLKYQQAQEEDARQKDVARGYVGLMSEPIPPMPGQASVPMQQPGMIPPPPQEQPQPMLQYAPVASLSGGPLMRAPDKLIQGGTIVPPRGNDSLALLQQELQSEQDPANRAALQRDIARVTGGQAPQTAPQIPPYQSFNQQAPQPQPGMIPPQPKLDWNTAIKSLQSKGITDPQTILAIMDKNQARLDTEAKMQLAYLKEQEMSQYHRDLAETRRMSVENQGRNIESMIADRPRRTEVMAQNAKTRAQQNGDSAASPEGVEAMAWDYLIRGHNPPARGGAYNATMKKVEEIAKKNGMSVQELASASADVKTKIAAKSQFERRAQNMQRAENQLDAEIPVFEQTVKDVNAMGTPALAKLELAARRQMGDPLVTKMDQAAEVIFREFEGIATGNPGALNVQDVVNAHNSYMNAQTPQQAKAAIEGMRRIIHNAKGAMEKTRNEIMSDINSSVNPNKGAAPKPGAVNTPIPQGWSVKEH